MSLNSFILCIFLAGFSMSALCDEILVSAPKEVDNFSAGTALTLIPVADSEHPQRTLAEFLNTSPGVYVSQSYGLKENTLSIRGFGKSQVKILLDGVPLDDAGGAFSLNDIPLTAIDKIVVARGPTSSLYGNAAMGGVVNIISKQNSALHKMQASYGSFATIDLSGQTLQSVGDNKILLLAFYNATNGRYQIRVPDDPLYDPGAKPERYTVQNNQQENHGARIGFTRGPWSSSLSYNEKTRGIPGVDTHPTLHIRERSRDYNFTLHRDSIALHKDLLVDAMLYQRGHSLHYEDPRGEQDGFVYDYTNRSLGLGGALAMKCIGSETIVPNIRILSDREHFDDGTLRASRDTWTLSTNAEIFAFDERLTISPSASKTFATQLPQENSYGLGLAFKVSKELTLTAQVGSGFRYPTFEELYIQRGFFVGNADLTPEHSLGGDLGFAWKQEKFEGSLSYFQYRTENLIDYLLSSGFQYKPFNFRSMKTRGMETQFTLGPVFATNIGAALTLQEIKDDDRGGDFYGKNLPMKPWFYGRVFADYTLSRVLSLSYEFAFAKTRFLNRSNTRKIPDNYSHNIGLATKYFDSYRVRIDVRNLYDRQNIDIRGFPLPGRGYYLSVEKIF